ncbi:MAG: hypothetical protein K2Z81_02315 [Cyanobacteria bacterium]|nr:hypothetical protein [Cyanobacteriota bacterium]
MHVQGLPVSMCLEPSEIVSLLDELDEDTVFFSAPQLILAGPSYDELSSLGQALIPYLLERIQDVGPSCACRLLLEQLTNENAGSWLEPSSAAGAKWIAWGRARGLIDEDRPWTWNQKSFFILALPRICYLCRKKEMSTASTKTEWQYVSIRRCEDCGVITERKRLRSSNGEWGKLLEKRVWRGATIFTEREGR